MIRHSFLVLAPIRIPFVLGGLKTNPATKVFLTQETIGVTDYPKRWSINLDYDPFDVEDPVESGTWDLSNGTSISVRKLYGLMKYQPNGYITPITEKHDGPVERVLLKTITQFEVLEDVPEGSMISTLNHRGPGRFLPSLVCYYNPDRLGKGEILPRKGSPNRLFICHPFSLYLVDVQSDVTWPDVKLTEVETQDTVEISRIFRLPGDADLCLSSSSPYRSLSCWTIQSEN